MCLILWHIACMQLLSISILLAHNSFFTFIFFLNSVMLYAVCILLESYVDSFVLKDLISKLWVLNEMNTSKGYNETQTPKKEFFFIPAFRDEYSIIFACEFSFAGLISWCLTSKRIRHFHNRISKVRPASSLIYPKTLKCSWEQHIEQEELSNNSNESEQLYIFQLLTSRRWKNVFVLMNAFFNI